MLRRRSDRGDINMKTKAAILWEVGKDWSVEEIDLDPPKKGEVLVRLVGSGLCHSDEHLLTGDLPFPWRIIGAHAGAGSRNRTGSDWDCRGCGPSSTLRSG